MAVGNDLSWNHAGQQVMAAHSVSAAGCCAISAPGSKISPQRFKFKFLQAIYRCCILRMSLFLRAVSDLLHLLCAAANAKCKIVRTCACKPC